jgi:hypothetical protein
MVHSLPELKEHRQLAVRTGRLTAMVCRCSLGVEGTLVVERESPLRVDRRKPAERGRLAGRALKLKVHRTLGHQERERCNLERRKQEWVKRTLGAVLALERA